MDQSVLTAAYQSALQIGVGGCLREGDFRDLTIRVEAERRIDRVSRAEYTVMQPAILPEDIQCQEDLQGAEDLLESAEESRLLSDLP